jgi:hypothetical protein
MIPEPDNKKGAFAPFDNRTILIILIVRTLKNYLSVCNLSFKLHSIQPRPQLPLYYFYRRVSKQPCSPETQFSQ